MAECSPAGERNPVPPLALGAIERLVGPSGKPPQLGATDYQSTVSKQQFMLGVSCGIRPSIRPTAPNQQGGAKASRSGVSCGGFAKCWHRMNEGEVLARRGLSSAGRQALHPEERLLVQLDCDLTDRACV